MSQTSVIRLGSEARKVDLTKVPKITDPNEVLVLLRGKIQPGQIIAYADAPWPIGTNETERAADRSARMAAALAASNAGRVHLVQFRITREDPEAAYPLAKYVMLAIGCSPRARKPVPLQPVTKPGPRLAPTTPRPRRKGGKIKAAGL